MTDDLQPISYQGFGRMLQAITGSSPACYYPLRDRPVRSVAAAKDGEELVFALMDGRTLTYDAVGDCCSRSWVEHVTVPPDLEGAVIDSYRELDVGESEVDHETVRVYQTLFRTARGEVVVEYRNSSNGYYGGWLSGPVEQWARDEIESAREADRG